MSGVCPVSAEAKHHQDQKCHLLPQIVGDLLHLGGWNPAQGYLQAIFSYSVPPLFDVKHELPAFVVPRDYNFQPVPLV